MSLLTTPPSSSSSLFFLKTQNLHRHNHNSLSSFSLLPSSTPFLSLSSTRNSSSRVCSSRSSSSSSDDDDEWGKEPKPSSFTIGTPDANVTFRVPDVWGNKSGSGSEPESKSSGPEEEDDDKPKSKPKSKSKNKSTSFTVGTSDANVTLNVANVNVWSEKSEPEPEPESKPKTKPTDSEGEDKSESEPKAKNESSSFTVGTPAANVTLNVPDEWGEKPGFEPEPTSRFTGPDPPIREDEDSWGLPTLPSIDVGKTVVDSFTPKESKENKSYELKRCLLDSVYGSELGFRVSAEVRAEVSELVSQLEALNPNPSPTEVSGLLDGNWILVYTAFSELLPLLAVGATPFLKVEQISQAINTASQVVENSTTLSSPFATFSFSATASFDVRSSSRIQVRFKEATFKPPEIKSRFDLPANIEVFGQTVTLSPVQQLLNPVQEAAASISRSLYGLPPLKISIPGERTASWLLFTYVDEDFRISRGDGGIFVLVREGSPLLNQ